jgi:hypothetical protein
MTQHGTTALFLFDYKTMDTLYGRQAFEAIYECLKASAGIQKKEQLPLYRGMEKNSACPTYRPAGGRMCAAHFQRIWIS